MTASYRFIVSGRVQGVRYRQSCCERAAALGLDGWVRNRDDGAVEGVAAGAAEALARLRDWLQRGPPAARVERLEWAPSDEAPTPGFEFRR